MVQAVDGGFVLFGHSSSSNIDVSANNGGIDFWLVKTDSEGVLLWERNLGGAGFDEGRDIRTTEDGGYILIGSSPSSNGDVGDNNGNYDYWVVKTDGLGMIEWETNLGGTENDRGWSVTAAHGGGYIAMGHSYSTNIDIDNNNGSGDYWIVKLDDSGNILWKKNYGGSEADRTRSIEQTADGGYILIGYVDSEDGDVGGNNGEEDIWIVKIDAEGEIEWEQNYGGSADERGRTIKQTSDGGYIVGGTSKSSDGDISEPNMGGRDIWFFKLNATGLLEWQQIYGGSQNDIVRDIQQTSDGGYILVGETASLDGDVGFNHGELDVWVLKTDAAGLLEWEKTLGGSDDELAYAIEETEYHSYVIGGYSRSEDGDLTGNYGVHDFWLVKIRDCVFPDLANMNLNECEAIAGNGRASFNLTAAFDSLATENGLEIKWFTTQNNTAPINNPSAFISSDSTIFLQFSIGDCLSDFLPIPLVVNPISPVTFVSEEICEGDEPIVINEQFFNQSDSYTIEGLKNVHGCDSIVILDLVVISPTELSIADAGEDQMVSKPTTMLSGKVISEEVFGLWSCNNGVSISEETNPATVVNNLVEGTNSFVWSLDHPLCGLYAADTVNILYQKDFFLPNVFTPNGDGSNDVFAIPGLYNNGVNSFYFSVFNRSGALVYEEVNYGNDWDGRDRSGNDLNEGTYYFVLRGGELRYEGSVLIVRE